MKKIIAILAFLLFISLFSIVADPIYLEVTVGGQQFFRWVELYSLQKYDENGNLTYLSLPTSTFPYEEWHEYDKKGNKTKYKNTDGTEEVYEYNKKGQMTKSKQLVPFEDEKSYKYDKKGNLILVKFQNGVEKINEYDSKGNLIHTKNTFGERELFYEYYEYDAKGNRIHSKNSLYGTDEWYEYDSSGNMIHSKKRTGTGYWYEYWYEYYSNGSQIYIKSSEGSESWIFKEYWNNGVVKSSSQYNRIN